MKKIEIPMFYTLVFYIEGNINQIDKQTKHIMKKYGFINAKKSPQPMTEHTNGRCIYLLKDLDKPNIGGGNYSKAIIIAFNTEACQLKVKGADVRKLKISTVCHEIRHLVDKIIEGHKVFDVETPAYLTGWISAELLAD